MREVSLERNTNETQIELTLNLDGAGRYQVDTGCGFLNHMLELFARHGRFDLVLTCHGDVEVDYHHTTESSNILPDAFPKALITPPVGITISFFNEIARIRSQARWKNDSR